MSHLTLATVAALLLAGLITAFPQSQITEAASAQSPGARTDKITIQGSAFTPPHIAVLKGTTVTWTQRDTIAHTVRYVSGPTQWNERPFPPYAADQSTVYSFTVNFATVGTIKYDCRIHPSMQGTIDVVEKFEDPVVAVGATDDLVFNPVWVNLSVKQGIAWTNTGTALHTVTFENETIGDLGEIAEGARVSFNFTAPGSFRYRCVYHSGDDFESGMVGKVIVGGNPTFPTVLRIQAPPDDSEVNGTVNLAGDVITGLGQAEVTAVEVDVDGTGNWTSANGTNSWAFAWDSNLVPNGPFTILVRALANGSEAATDGIDVFVNNTMPEPTKEGGGGIPSVGAIAVYAGVLAALAGVRGVRRRD